METTRRGFLKTVGAMVGAAILPVTLITTMEMEPVIDEQLLRKAITVGPSSSDRLTVCVTVDQDKMWKAVHLEDQWGRQWRTPDGRAWSCGDHWFTVEGECSWMTTVGH